MKVFPVVFFLIIVFIKPVCSQPLNYPEIFGNNWQTALAFVSENKNWIEPKLKTYHISYPLAMAVVFPELVRYSALRDKIEITLLKTLYINQGNEYADFSIGPLQMKPSFAEMIHEKAPLVMGRRTKYLFKDRADFDDIKSFRTSIVKDLEDPKSQINYLIAFFKICESDFKLKWKDEDDKLKFFATAYNYGFYKTVDQIKIMTNKRFFNTKVFKTDNYSYADISLYWYNQYNKDSMIFEIGSGMKNKH